MHHTSARNTTRKLLVVAVLALLPALATCEADGIAGWLVRASVAAVQPLTHAVAAQVDSARRAFGVGRNSAVGDNPRICGAVRSRTFMG
jgi:hypothetical protein